MHKAQWSPLRRSVASCSVRFSAWLLMAWAGLASADGAPETSALKDGAAFRDCAPCPEMVVVPGGSFLMGSPPQEKERFADEGPQRRVHVKRFAAGRFEIKVGEFAQFFRASNYRTDADRAGGCSSWNGLGYERRWYLNWVDPLYKQTEEHPVSCVSWSDAQAYLAWLNEQVKAAGVSATYRLLSEAEWEYAARAGSDGRWSFGDDEQALGAYAWYRDNSAHASHPVGQKKPNAFGLFDMHGNVWEWVEDLAHVGYEGAPTDGSVWVHPFPYDRRVMRGGSWKNTPRDTRCATYDWFAPDFRFNYAGFRVARSLP